MDEALDPPFAYSNLTGRPRGALVRALGTVMPGIAAVQSQVEPYAAVWREANRAALRGERMRWVAFGDSMTQGIGASDPANGWVGQLQRRLPAAVDVVNLSQSGGRVEDVVAQQLPAWRSLPAPLGGEVVTVLIGSNDVVSPRHRGLLVEGFAELLGALPPGALVSGLPSPSRSAAAVNELIADAEREGRVVMVPTDRFDAEAWRGRLAADRFHPNDAGYSLIADAFEPYVRRAVAARSPGSRRGLGDRGSRDADQRR